MSIQYPAPEWEISHWLNTEPLSLADLRGKVIVVHAFQMLCRGCATVALPQLQRVANSFPSDRVAAVGLHTVFEHHAVQGPEALEAFLHENRYSFPVGVDMRGENELFPRTMSGYGMEGTPTLLLIDAEGRLREQHLGNVSDLYLGYAIGGLLAEFGPHAS